MNNRIHIARKGALISGLELIIDYILRFITRRVILISIGIDYLGLNSTLVQILGALSVTELGIQGVIVYRLYKPLAEGERNKICELMSVIRFFYRIVSLVIFLSSIALLPSLKWLITDVSIPEKQIYIAWLLMAISSSFSYTMSYNSAIIYADQKQYIYQGIHLVFNLFIVLLNLFLLFNFKNYTLYLFIYLINTLLGNFVLLFLRKKMYPWLEFVKISSSLIKEVAHDVIDVFAGRICGYIFNSTDNIVISSMISTSMVGYVSNYSTLTSAVALLISSICGPVQAIVGNMLVSENNEKMVGLLRKYSYVLYFIGLLLILPTALLLDDFVTLFYGEKYLLNNLILYLLIAYLYLAMAQSATATFLDADGQFKIEKHFYIISSLINIFLSVIGAWKIGVVGVLLATVIGSGYLLFCRVYYCFKFVIKDTGKPLRSYILFIVKTTIMFIASLISLRIIFNLCLSDVTILNFILKAIITSLFIVFTQFIVFRRSAEFKYLIDLIDIRKNKV